MNPFKFHVPTKIIFQRCCAQSIGEILVKQGIHSSLIVTDGGVRRASCVRKVIDSLDDSNISYDVFDGVEQNPKEENVIEALEMLRSSSHESIIAVGGGSVIDTAKATLALMKECCDIHELYRREVTGAAPITLIAIPTTAGTGSEVTRSAVITDAKAKVKETIRGECLYPKIALVDPELTISLPKSITASTGMDALTHALEAYISKNAHVMSDALAIEATRLIFENLRTAVEDGHDIEARSCMSAASTLAGMAFSISGLGMVHAMAEPLGGRLNVPHGIANSVLLPYCLEFNCGAVMDKLARLGRILNINAVENCNSSIEDAANSVVNAVRELSADVGIPHHLNHLEISQDEFEALVNDAMKNSCLPANPRKVGKSDLSRIYSTVLRVG
ncbi:MAG: iron-containing alcohol dehydrogenase [Methanomassiliicoccales archaeon]|nr:iron-containing alcohol dehydrogenase [Methanomassiliicoccales archaeon]